MAFVTTAIVAVLIVAVSYIFLLGKKRHHYWQDRGVFVPYTPPIIGHLLPIFGFGYKRNEYIDKIYSKFHDVKYFGLYEAFTPSLSISDPGIIKSIMIKDFDHFVDRRPMNFRNEYFSNMVSIATGAKWKRIRSIMTPTFTSGKMKSMFPLVRETADNLLKHCAQYKDANSAIDLKTAFSKFTIDVIGTCAFGMQVDSLFKENDDFTFHAMNFMKSDFKRSLDFFILLSAPEWLSAFLIPRFTSPELEYFSSLSKQTIEARQKGIRRGDFLDLMIEALQNHEETEKQKFSDMDETCVISQSILFIIAGFETTANSLTFTTMLLSQHPECQERMYRELMDILQDEERDEITYKDVMEAPYLDAVFNESLRRYSPAIMVERQCTKEYQLPGTNLVIPQDMMISVPIWSLNHDSRYFTEPYKFNPDRFMPENKDNIPQGVFFPFGVGPRMCIAQRFAQMEAKLALAKMVLEYEFSPAPGCEEIKVNIVNGLQRPVDNTAKVIVKKRSGKK